MGKVKFVWPNARLPTVGGVVPINIISRKPVQFWNATCTISVTDAGIVIVGREIQLLNIACGILRKPFGSFISTSCLQL